MEWIDAVIGNLVLTCYIKDTYIDEDEPWSGILDQAELVIYSNTKSLKGYSPDQLLFGSNMIIPIKHMAGWELIHQRKSLINNKDKIRENSKRVYHK